MWVGWTQLTGIGWDGLGWRELDRGVLSRKHGEDIKRRASLRGQHTSLTFFVSGPFPWSAFPKCLCLGWDLTWRWRTPLLRTLTGSISSRLVFLELRCWHVFWLMFALLMGAGEMAHLAEHLVHKHSRGPEFRSQAPNVKSWAQHPTPAPTEVEKQRQEGP